MEMDPTRMCALLVGLPAVRVLGVNDVTDATLAVHVELDLVAPACPGCGGRVRAKDRPPVDLVDLPCFGPPDAPRVA